MTCYCEQCSENPKPTYSEEYRHECEVRHVAKQKVPWIREHLGKVKEKRCEAEYHRLRHAVLIEREKIKSE